MPVAIEPKCSIEGIQALVPQYQYFDVDVEGNTTDWIADNSQTHGRLDIEEYLCQQCGEFFTPDKRYDYEALNKAWLSAVAHLTDDAKGNA